MSKNFKKIFALMLSVCLLLGMTTVAFAADDEEDVIIAAGDVNKDGKLTAADARLALRVAAQLEGDLDAIQLWVADVEADNKITANDARTILRVSARIDSFDELTSYYDAKVIIDAITTGLSGYTTDEKNTYLTDVVTALAAFAADFVEEDTLAIITAFLSDAVATLGDADWTNVEAAIGQMLPPVLKWAAASDVADVAALIKEGKSSNEVLAAVAPMLLTDEAIDAVLGALKEEGFIGSLKLGLDLLDKANILEAVYEAYAALPDALEFDSYEDAYDALVEELDYLETVKFADEIANLDAWIAEEIDNVTAAQIRDFIVALLANEPVVEEPEEPEEPELTSAEIIIAGITDGLAGYTVAQKNLYLVDVIGSVEEYISSRNYLDAETLALISGFLKDTANQLGEIDWVNVNNIIETVLPAILDWAADEDVDAIAAMVGEKSSGEILNVVIDMLLTDEVLDIVLDELANGDIVATVKTVLAILDQAGILEAVYDAYAALPDALTFEDYGAAYDELLEKIDYLAGQYASNIDDVEAFLVNKISTIDKEAAKDIFISSLKDILAN
ncbi:MAG: dockerin type I repeat-containing protein [Oscillospiraceae bacterium]|jgi:hypothetical protein|nr:dockerin type I repeat-containing protein [Oscillospiraceae bacterium]